MIDVNRPAKEAAARYSTAKDCARLYDLGPPVAVYAGGGTTNASPGTYARRCGTRESLRLRNRKVALHSRAV
jgi:hypothetical protein